MHLWFCLGHLVCTLGKHKIHAFACRQDFKELHKEAEIPEATQCVHETQGVLLPNLERNPVLR